MMEFTTLDDGFRFPRIINGMWQVSGGHGKINYKNALNDIVEYISSGLNTFDMADHYGPSEELFGEVITQVRSGRVKLDPNNIHGFTKWFPPPGSVTQDMTTKAVKKAMAAMKVDRLDLLQFHWWDYDDERYMDALAYLKVLQCQSQPVIRHIGLTNFDTIRVQRIVNSGIKIATNQVSYSIIDRRVEKKMSIYCKEKSIYIIAYGVCLGGLISEKFLGVPDPSQVALNTWSLTKYRNFVERWGGWRMFQDLLEVLKRVGNKHGVSLTMVAIRFILDQTQVGGAVIGCRWGITKHKDELVKDLYSFKLDSDDYKQINNAANKGDTMLGWKDC
ncbi:hypothetical protein SAMD00019534_118880, partial [Acytostelium subglobosum LB1]|uniref:hypothetical protein n=1 Tax=Acytostelium subglobosum LB1 TaxID=1410327 RepID=UPI000644FCCD